MAMSSRSAFLLSRGWLPKSAPASVVMSIRNEFSLPFGLRALSRKDHVSSTTNWTLLSRMDRASAWWSSRLWVRELHPVFVQDTAWRRVVTSGSRCHDTYHQQVPPRHVTPGACLRFPSTGAPPSCLLARPPGIPQMPWRPFPMLPCTLP